MFRSSMSAWCGCLVVLSVTLQGCLEETGASQPTTTTTTDVFEGAWTVQMSDNDYTTMTDCLAILAKTPGDADCLKKVQESIKATLGDYITDGSAAVVKNGMLDINVSMKPIEFLDGVVKIQRAKDDDTQGPIFAMSLKLKDNGDFDPATVGKDLMQSAAVHVEGFGEVIPFCEGYLKLLVNQGDYRFHLEFAYMDVYSIFKAFGSVKVDKDYNVQATGGLHSDITVLFSKGVAEALLTATKPLTVALATLIAAKNTCISVLCNAAEKAYNDFVTALGDIAEYIKAMVDVADSEIEKYFNLEHAKFDVEVGKDDSGNACLEFDLKATMMMQPVEHKIELCMKDPVAALAKILDTFAKPIIDKLQQLITDLGL